MPENKSPRLVARLGALAAATTLALAIPTLLAASDRVLVSSTPVAHRINAPEVVGAAGQSEPPVPVVPPPTTTTTLPPPPPVGETAASFALSTLGTPYRYGGSNPGGFDCSGLVMWSFRQAGVTVPRTAGEQRSATARISEAELRPGDLVFYRGTGHVGIFIGNGSVVHSPRSGKSVEIVPLNRGGMSASSFGRVK
jgi:cell wall-associated NlpC family hydrolase